MRISPQTIIAIVGLIASELLASVRPGAKTLFMKDTDIAHISVWLGQSTILSFPTKPSKVVLGNKELFGVEYIDNDLAISALRPQARCNLIVYLPGRRFSFEISASHKSGDSIILIRDAEMKKKKWKSNPKS